MKVSFFNCHRHPAKRQSVISGWTLVELLMAVGIGTVVLAAVILTSVTSLKSFASMFNYTDMNMTSRTAMDQISKEIRSATGVSVIQTNMLRLVNANSGITTTYTWSNRTLSCAKTGQPDRTLLTDCDSWNVAMFQKTPTTNYDNIATPVKTQAKLISLSWKCSRTVVGLLNTETVQEARIVIRN